MFFVFFLIVSYLTVLIITFGLHALIIHYFHLYLFLMLNISISVSLESPYTQQNTTANFLGCEDVIGKKRFQDNHHMWQMQHHIVYKPPACCSQTADISSFLSSTILPLLQIHSHMYFSLEWTCCLMYGDRITGSHQV